MTRRGKSWRMRARRLALSGALALATGPLAAADTPPIQWSALVDATAQTFDDPYRALAPPQLNSLATVARLRDRLTAPNIPPEARARISDRLTASEADLAAQDLDVDWILEQRWVVAERRAAAASAANPALDGQEVAITGFLIPAPRAADGTYEAYLVPETGMCAHIPPPPPNQLLRLRFTAPPEITGLFAPVRVRGTLRQTETRREMMVVDGMVQMWSVWTLEAQSLTAADPAPLPQ